MLQFVKTIGGQGRKILMKKLGISQTFAVGDLVKTYATGAADLGTAATPSFGVITGFVNANGTPISESDIVAGTAAASGVTSVTTDGTNSTNYHALIDISKDTVYSAAVNGTVGTTVDSELGGTKIDIDSANTSYGRVLESTATRTVATTANFYNLGVDPANSARLLVVLASSEFDNDQNTEA